MTDRQNKELRFQTLRKEINIFETLGNVLDKRAYAESIRNKLIYLAVYDTLFTYEQCIFFEKSCTDFGIEWLKINKRAQVISNFLLYLEEVIQLHDIGLLMSPEAVYPVFNLIKDSPETWGKLLDIDSVKSYAAFLAAFPDCYGVDSLDEFKTVIHTYIDNLGIN